MLVYQRVIYILWIFHIYVGLLEANSDQMQRSTRWTIIRAFRWIRPRFYPVNPEDLIIQCVTTVFARSLCLFCSIYLLLCFCNSLCQTSKHPAIHFCGMVFNWADNISKINVHHPIGCHIYYTNPYVSKWFMLILWYIMAVLQAHPPDYASPKKPSPQPGFGPSSHSHGDSARACNALHQQQLVLPWLLIEIACDGRLLDVGFVKGFVL